MPNLGFPLAAPFGDQLAPDEAEVLQWLIALWPPGVRDLYDLDNPDADVAGYFEVLARTFRHFGTAPVDQARVEFQPATCVEKLPDWEAALGITASRAASSGATAPRQAAIVAKLRESGSYDLPDLRAILGPLLGYADPSQLQVIECPRSALAALHTASDGAPVQILGGGSVSRTLSMHDAPAVSVAGAQLRLWNFNLSNTSDITIELAGPGATKIWTSGVDDDDPLTLRSLAFAGTAILGDWTLTVSSVSGDVSFDSWDLFVEGAGHDGNGVDGLGAQIFEWSVVVDPALAGATYAPDLDAARAAMSRTKPAHTCSFLVRKMTGGSLCAICDDPNAISDACVCC